MKLLEVKNNLIKLAYEYGEAPVLGRFLILGSEDRSYVAQFVNLKSDSSQNYAIGKLLFTFTPDGVVDDYDGSVPSMESELSLLDVSELLDILPVETAIKIGNLAQQDNILSVDISVFEHNLTVFSEQVVDKTCFISNCVRQLFQLKEKSVIIDTEKMFDAYPKIKFSKDFKLPLNPQAIDFLFDYELSEVDANTKAIIQDIFYNVQEYIKTLEYQFLPIDSFVDVVSAQYKETQMPELALLKNKLLKYRDENIFANSKEEFLSLGELVEEKNCSIIDLNNIGEALQNLVIKFIHSELNKSDKYIYLFVSLNDYNSDKKLLKQLINHNHIFTTVIVSSNYKYSRELKSYAQNLILFAPAVLEKDFMPYAAFLNKLNSGECIVYGNLTQNIPFIVSMSDLELPLTKDDILGEKYRFVPVKQDLQLVHQDGTPVMEAQSFEEEITEDEPEEQVEIEQEQVEIEPENDYQEEIQEEELNFDEEEAQVEEAVEDDLLIAEPEEVFEGDVSINEEDEIVSVDEFGNEDLQNSFAAEDVVDLENLTESDLDLLDGENFDSNAQEEDVEEQTPVVPVYPADEQAEDEIVSDFAKGDTVSHPRYGRGVVEKIIKYGNKTLCSISFDNVGRRLLDPSISEFEKI